MQTTTATSEPSVPMLFDRALTDVIRARRMVEETERRLVEARSILEALGTEPSDVSPWSAGLDEALLHLEAVRRILQTSAAPREGSVTALTRDEAVFEGEAPSISERLLIAPTRGRLHRHRVRAGRRLEPGTVIGELRSIRGRVQIRAWMHSTFLEWIVREGELVHAGHPIAIVLPSDAREGTSVIRRP